MFGKVHTPSNLTKNELDHYLESGWYRMGQAIFTCNVLNFDFNFYNAIWLRVKLPHLEDDSTFIKLKKINAKFRIAITKAKITDAEEQLFTKYKTAVRFETANSIRELLLHTSLKSIFDTRQISLYDEDKLIGVGYFDLGKRSAAGIVSFYDPDYKKHSLGKYLIYNKISFCKQQNITYFYPGYFSPTYPVFDYKLDIGRSKIEYLDIFDLDWKPIDTFSLEKSPLSEFVSRMNIMQEWLLLRQIDAIRFKYEYYNANIILNLKDLDLFDFPEFFFVRSAKYLDFYPILVFDVLEGKYMLFRYVSCFQDDAYVSKEGYYGTHLLKISEVLYASEFLNDISNFLLDPVSVF